MSKLLFYLGLLLTATFAYAANFSMSPVQGEMAHLPPREGVQGQDLSLEVIYTGDQADISAAKILYRLSGQVGYLETSMSFKGMSLVGTIPGENIAAPGIDYVIVLQLKDGGILAYPEVENPTEQPVYVPIIEPQSDVQNRRAGAQSGQIIVLTPEPGETVSYDDEVVIAVSLFNLENVDVNSIKVFFDNVNVTPYSVASEDLVTYKPDYIKPGRHTISIEVSNLYKVRIGTTSWNFSVESKAASLFAVDLHSNLTLSSRSNLINIKSQDSSGVTVLTPNQVGVNRMDLSVDADLDWIRLTTTMNLTSQESPDKQPQNRYIFNARNSWIRYTYGDASPMMNRLGLWGKRVRGHNLKFLWNWGSLQIVSGNTGRAIVGTANAIFDSSNTRWSRNNYAFERHLFGIRPAFGSGRNFQWGFFYVHARDSVNSVKLKPNLNLDYQYTIPGSDSTIPIHFGDQNLIAFGDTTAIGYGFSGLYPEDNIVVGSDLAFGMDDRRLLLELEGALSLTNKNIFDGALTRAELDTFALLADSSFDDTLGSGSIDLPFAYIDDLISNAGLGFLLTDNKFDPGKLEKYFVLNQNILVPLDAGKYKTSVLKSLTSIAYSMRLRLNYFNNFVSVNYNYVAPSFRAAGSPFITNDNAGWKISDKIRLLNNMLYLNLGYEFKKDNVLSLNETDDPRTAYSSVIGGFTFNPGRGLPTFTANLKSYNRDNNIDTLSMAGDTILSDPRILDNTLSSSINLGYNINLGDIQNNINLNYMNSSRNDLRVGQKSLMQSAALVGVNLRSEWTIPMITTVTIRRNTNQLFTEANPFFRSNAFTTLGGAVSYNMFAGKFNLRGGFTEIMQDQKSYDENNVLTTLPESQSKFELSVRYRFKTLNIAQYAAKSQIVFLSEFRKYNGSDYNYTDHSYFLRYEMGF